MSVIENCNIKLFSCLLVLFAVSFIAQNLVVLKEGNGRLSFCFSGHQYVAEIVMCLCTMKICKHCDFFTMTVGNYQNEPKYSHQFYF